MTSELQISSLTHLTPNFGTDHALAIHLVYVCFSRIPGHHYAQLVILRFYMSHIYICKNFHSLISKASTISSLDMMCAVVCGGGGGSAAARHEQHLTYFLVKLHTPYTVHIQSYCRQIYDSTFNCNLQTTRTEPRSAKSRWHAISSLVRTRA